MTQSVVRKRLFSCIALLMPFWLHAQLVADPGTTPADAVNLILDVGAQVSNITYAGGDEQIGSFECTNCGVNFDGGMIISSGSVAVANSPNNGGGTTLGGGNFGVSDPDLAQANPFFTLNDAAVIEFDFVAQGDSVVFNYVWASEEYPEFVFSSFNDAFGFFLSGPGINGPFSNNAENIAIIPGTTLPVTIDNVNAGNNDMGCTNCEFYVINTNNGDPNSVQFDGFTVPLQAAYGGLTCGETYHIKIAVADAGDTGLDSAVFFEENSFYTPTLDVSLNIGEIGLNDSTIYEGCSTSELIFIRNGQNLPEEILQIDVGGTAENGVDFSEIPGEIVFPPGINEVVIPITAFLDGETEGVESIIFTYTGGGECLIVQEQIETVYIAEPEPLLLNADDLFIDCNETATLQAEASGGYGLYTYVWEDGTSGPELTVSPGSTSSYSVTVSDTCGVEPVETEVTVEVQTYDPLIPDAGGPIEIDCLTFVEGTADASGGNGEYTYVWYDPQGNEISQQALVEYDPDQEGSLTLQVTDGCGATGTDELQYTFASVEVIVNLPDGLEAPCQESIELQPLEVSGGIGAFTYQWTVNGTDQGSAESIEVVVNDAQTVMLTVEDECGNIQSDQVTVELTPTPIDLVLPADFETPCLTATAIEPESLSGGVGDYTFSWSADDGTVSDEEFFSVTPDSEVGVTLIVTDECGNVASAELNIGIAPDIISVDLGQDLIVTCLDVSNIEPAIEGGTGPYAYTWIESGEEVSSDDNLLLQADENTSIELLVTDACGFTGGDELLVNVPPVPLSVDLGSDLLVPCQEEVALYAAPEGGVGEYIYDWFVNENEAESNSPTLEFMANGNLMAEVMVEDACGNTTTDQIQITIPENPPQLLITVDTLICRGESVNLNVEVVNPIGSYQYIWMPGGQSQPSITVSPQESQSYTVTVIDACLQIAEESVAVSVDQVNASFDFSYTDGWGIETFNTSFPQDASFTWDFDDGTIIEEFEPTHEFLTNGTQVITLTAETAFGCRDSIFGVFNPEMDIFVPNAFTPDGDGVNDVFKAEGHSIRSFKLWIYNRWGELVFYSESIDEPWLGEVNGGAYYGQNEVYNWVIEAVGIRNNSFERKGTVILIR